MCLSIKRFSYKIPDFFETTGCSGTSPETVRKKKTEIDKKLQMIKEKQSYQENEKLTCAMHCEQRV